MSPPPARRGTGARAAAALVVGIVAGLVAGVDLVRWVRPEVLTDPSASWMPARLLLGLGVAAAAAAAGGLAAAVFLAWSRLPGAAAPLAPIALGRTALAALALAAILAGAGLRFIALARAPSSLWVDDLSLIAPALALSAGPADFADAIRPTPYGVDKPYGSVGVVYLEGYRGALKLWGTTVFGVRFPSAAAGAASLVTAALLGSALLPAGGGALAALVLAGLRWHLIVSRWGWNMIALAPIVDLAGVALIRARRRASAGCAGAAGAAAGLGAHVYLSAWPAAAGLLLYALWPGAEGPGSRPRLRTAAAFALGFALVAAPLFLFREGRAAPYFARAADHNVVLEMRRAGSALPPVAAAADAIVAPWALDDPSARHDLPGRTRLGGLLGALVAIAFGRALLRPRDPLSGFLLSLAIAAAASVVAGGQADNPNGSRFAYLASPAAVAAAAGTMWLCGLVPLARRRAAAIAAVGALSIAGALAARDALLVWPERPETFDGFHGQDTLVGRAAARWRPYGSVEIEPRTFHSRLAVDAVVRYALDPDGRGGPGPGRPAQSRFRIGRRPALSPGERVVERVRDDWGREWAVVVASSPARR